MHPLTWSAVSRHPCSAAAAPAVLRLGSETQRTATWVPDPYDIEIGDPDAVPEGYEAAAGR
jgi:hypothetical protein